MTAFEWLCIGILAGAITTLIAIGIGAMIIGPEDDDVKIYTLKHRRVMSNDELAMILYNLRLGASSTERAALDQIIDRLDNDKSGEIADLAKKLNVKIGG